MSYPHCGPLASADIADEKSDIVTSTDTTPPPSDSTAVVTEGGDSCKSDESIGDADDAGGADGEKEAVPLDAGKAEGNVVVGEGTPSDPEEQQEMDSDVEGDGEGGPGTLAGAKEEKGVLAMARAIW